MVQEPVRQSRLDILEREVIEQPDEHPQMLAHRSQHAERKLGTTPQELDEIRFRHEQDRALPSLARPPGNRSGSPARLGKGFDRPKEMDHLFLPGRTFAMHVHPARWTM